MTLEMERILDATDASMFGGEGRRERTMPLTRPRPRDLIHSRDIRCRGYRRGDGLWDVEACLEDTKAYSFDNHDRHGIVSGEPIHRMLVRITVDHDLVVHAAEAETEAGPFTICGDIAPVFASLVGERVGRGWRRTVIERMGGVRGCTHLTDLLLGPVAQTVLQTVAASRSRRASPTAEGGKPPLIDSCHALASGGPVVRRQWPDFHEPDE